MKNFLQIAGVVISLLLVMQSGEAEAQASSGATVDWNQPSPAAVEYLRSLNGQASSGTSSGVPLKKPSLKDEIGRLTVTTKNGTAPLFVKILGPSNLLQYGYGTDDRPGGCGFEVMWGDGVPAWHECERRLHHHYQRAGIYHLTARINHLTAPDGSTVDWHDTVEIHVK